MFVCKVAGVLFIAFDIPLQGFLFAKVGVSVLFVHLYVCSRDNPHRVCVCGGGGGCICETKFKISPCLYAAAF